ncbi:MAG: 2OG-Fe(II) oxygenase [Rhodospirillaceae bacterium]|nr:2OG-Fe(II) oxygenase [Rhodospirillaceae bacterium]
MPPQTKTRLEVGARFPNFQMHDVYGGQCEFYRNVIGGPTLLLCGRSILIDLPDLPAGTNAIMVHSGDGEPKAPTDRHPRKFFLLDPNDALRRRFTEEMAGASALAIILDANQRVIEFKAASDITDLANWARVRLATTGRATGPAPVLVLPRVFEPDFCRRLISIWDEQHEEGRVSATVDGDPKSLLVPDFKKRLDHQIERGSPLYKEISHTLGRKLAGDVEKAFTVDRFRSEAYYVACYDAERGDFFGAHRDNNSPKTANRQFAVSINLNDDFDGGGVNFPEYNDEAYRPETGGAVVFSCSLMHEALSVTRGKRFAFLGFLCRVSSEYR